MNPGPSPLPSTPNSGEIPPDENAADAMPHSSFTRRLVAPALKYLEGRGQLLGLETQEAVKHAIAILVWLTIGAVTVFAGWLLLATSLVGVLTKYFEWSWVKATAIAGAAHILIAAIAALVAWKRLTTSRWFADSLNELKNDRTWLKTQTTKN